MRTFSLKYINEEGKASYKIVKCDRFHLGRKWTEFWSETNDKLKLNYAIPTSMVYEVVELDE
jgi:hypothetical protein